MSNSDIFIRVKWNKAHTIACKKPFCWAIVDNPPSLVIHREFGGSKGEKKSLRTDEFELSTLAEKLTDLDERYGIEGIPLVNSVTNLPNCHELEGLGPAICVDENEKRYRQRASSISGRCSTRDHTRCIASPEKGYQNRSSKRFQLEFVVQSSEESK